MAVNTKTQSSTETAVAAPPAPIPTEQTLSLELSKCNRYMHNGFLYVKDQPYVFKLDDARRMLQIQDPQDLPIFRLARPRTRMVEVPVEQRQAKLRPVDNISMPLEDFVRSQMNGGDTNIQPLGKIEMGEDDHETAARLAQIDAEAGLLDSAQGVKV